MSSMAFAPPVTDTMELNKWIRAQPKKRAIRFDCGYAQSIFIDSKTDYESAHCCWDARARAAAVSNIDASAAYIAIARLVFQFSKEESWSPPARIRA